MGSTPSSSVAKTYKGRPHDSVPTNMNLTREAVAMLLRHTPDNPRGRGEFLSRLVVEYDRRQTFQDFLEEAGRKELKRLCRQVAREVRREGA
jgi:hypothetical protein